jgi:hypothetical protein
VIALSGILTPLAVGLLIAGIVTGRLPIMIGAVAASVAASAFLYAAIRQRRALPPPEAPALPEESLDMPFPPMAPTPPTQRPVDPIDPIEPPGPPGTPDA